MPERKNRYDTEYNRRMFPGVVERHKRKKKSGGGMVNNMSERAARELHRSQRKSGKTVFGKIAEYVPEWMR